MIRPRLRRAERQSALARADIPCAVSSRSKTVSSEGWAGSIPSRMLRDGVIMVKSNGDGCGAPKCHVKVGRANST